MLVEGGFKSQVRLLTRTLFIHVGPPKTGTTAIQFFFRDNAAVFASQGLYWPKTGTELRSHYHLALVDAFTGGWTQGGLLEKLGRELEEAGRPERVFISAEHFSLRLAQKGFAEKLRGHCARLGYTPHLIAYIRPQAPMLNSLFTQSVKNWQPVGSIETFLESEMRSGLSDYLRQFAPFLGQSSFAVTLRPYNRETLTDGITRDICKVLGVNADQVKIPQERMNVTPGPKTLAAFQRLRRRATRDFSYLKREDLAGLTWPLLRTAGAMGWNDEKYSGISPAAGNVLNWHFTDSNDKLARHIWSKPWSEVFAAEDAMAPPYNVFEPAEAEPEARLDFQDFVSNAMELIGNLSANARAGRKLTR
jgi:hypothetical protein